MQKKSLKPTLMWLLGIAILSMTVSSCGREPRVDFGGYVEGPYEVDGYIYPLNNPNVSFGNYYNVALDIEWVGYNKVVVSMYDNYDYLDPFYQLPCYVEYDYYEDAYYLYNGYYPDMLLYVYSNGYVYLDFPYITYRNTYCGYFFTGYYWYGPYYKPGMRKIEAPAHKAPADTVAERPVAVSRQ